MVLWCARDFPYLSLFCAVFSFAEFPANVRCPLPNPLSVERPMRIELVVDPSKPLPLASRVTPAVKAAAATKLVFF